MALQTGAAGGQGGAGSYGTAVSRIDVIDPHIVIMMRDVMDAAETAPRLKVSGAAGSGGGGGGVAFDASGNASQGETPGAGDNVNSCIVTSAPRDGGQGAGGSEGVDGSSGSGGGGGGGKGGAIIIITTTAEASIGTKNTASAGASPNGNINVTGGERGAGGTAYGSNASANGGNGGVGGNGKYIPIVV